ncbi:lectin OAA family protein [Tenacibaculum sp. nBUS_03]|uniref:lectin OAA family protein n=1 Tax=Tenacibaculum sp. nBUS_03 TaxID=3395320 RepID=UPI003EBEE4C0
MSIYQVQNKWGDSPLQQGGIFVLGSRSNQELVDININSTDGGKTLTGTITYKGEGPIGFKGVQVAGNNYKVENEWSNTWNDGGNWVIGARDGQNVVALKVSAVENTKDLKGEVTYEGEGPIVFQGKETAGSAFEVQNQWGGPNSPWNPGGVFVLGSRDKQQPIALDIKSNDEGQTFTGTMTYEGEGPIDLEATFVMGNVYSVQNKWGGPWHSAGYFIIGARENQRAVELKVSSNNEGQTLTGKMTYKGEGPIEVTASTVDKLTTV